MPESAAESGAEPAPKCVILVASVPYSEAHAARLRAIYDQGVDLFCAVGVDCEMWEDAMDWLCIELDMNGEQPGAFCVTTAHEGETLAEVMEFVEDWCDQSGWPRNIEVVEI